MHSEIKKAAQRSLKIEGNAILALSEQINNDFIFAVEKILVCSGRLVVTGIGKSAIIATKIVATLNSTGTPAVFMHAADAVHGDLGMIQQADIVLCISQSGNTPEIKLLLPMLRHAGNLLIGMTGDPDSYLATNSDLVILSTIEEEACPLKLAPTTSTAVQLALGDALAVCLLEQRGFTEKDFARYHPGGALGKRLYLRVDDLVRNNLQPQVPPTADLKQVIVSITTGRLGVTAVVDAGKLLGIITDGDVRRMLDKHTDLTGLTAAEVMSPQPRCILTGAYAVDALQLIRSFNITQLLVVDEQGLYKGVVHIHDLLKEGII
ncbi:MAG: KpsF/GutQ family sugar-phosphate isomerase [Sphingobacteriaceae bacterium]|nr:KpsF/GutQ family sugar-phosphate isomerase [Sphingobacteriaceae bacterium]